MAGETKNIYQRMAAIKAELAKIDIKKSGFNKYQDFHYHELKDFLVHITTLNNKHGVDDNFEIVNEIVTLGTTTIIEKKTQLVLINVDNPEDIKIIRFPYVEAQMLAKGGKPSTTDAIQRMGSTLTYNRRYAYMVAYDIQESDSVDNGPSPKDFENDGKQVDESTVDVAGAKIANKLLKHLEANVVDLEMKKAVLLEVMTELELPKWEDIDFSKLDIGKTIDLITAKAAIAVKIRTEESESDV